MWVVSVSHQVCLVGLIHNVLGRYLDDWCLLLLVGGVVQGFLGGGLTDERIGRLVIVVGGVYALVEVVGLFVLVLVVR